MYEPLSEPPHDDEQAGPADPRHVVLPFSAMDSPYGRNYAVRLAAVSGGALVAQVAAMATLGQNSLPFWLVSDVLWVVYGFALGRWHHSWKTARSIRGLLLITRSGEMLPAEFVPDQPEPKPTDG